MSRAWSNPASWPEDDASGVLVPAMRRSVTVCPPSDRSARLHVAHHAVGNQVLAADIDRNGTVRLLDGLDADQLGKALQGLQPLVFQPDGVAPGGVPALDVLDLQVQRADLAGQTVDVGRHVRDVGIGVGAKRLDLAGHLVDGCRQVFALQDREVSAPRCPRAG